MSYFDPYEFYDQVPLSDESALSSQLWDLYAPTSDTQAWNRINKAFPYWNEFSPDALMQADPMIRGALADAITQGEQDPYQTYSVMQSDDYQKQLGDMLGKSEWDDLAQRGDIDSYLASLTGDSGDREQAALDYTNNALESVFNSAAPSASRNLGQIDYATERFGGRPYPGGELPGFSGPGFSGGGDPMGGMMPGGGGGMPMQGGGGGQAPDMGSPLATGSANMYGGEAPIELGEAEDPTSRIEMTGPDGYKRIVVLRGKKFALPDTLPGPTGTSPAYMQELQSRARERGIELDRFGGMQRPRGWSMEDDDGRNGDGRSAPANRFLDHVPGVGDIRNWLRERLPRGSM